MIWGEPGGDTYLKVSRCEGIYPHVLAYTKLVYHLRVFSDLSFTRAVTVVLNKNSVGLTFRREDAAKHEPCPDRTDDLMEIPVNWNHTRYHCAKGSLFVDPILHINSALTKSS